MHLNDRARSLLACAGVDVLDGHIRREVAWVRRCCRRDADDNVEEAQSWQEVSGWTLHFGGSGRQFARRQQPLLESDSRLVALVAFRQWITSVFVVARAA